MKKNLDAISYSLPYTTVTNIYLSTFATLKKHNKIKYKCHFIVFALHNINKYVATSEPPSMIPSASVYNCGGLTCASILGNNGEVALLARDAMSQPGAIRSHKAAVDGVNVELERAARNRFVVVGHLQ